MSEAYIETSSNATSTMVSSASSSFYQPKVGTAIAASQSGGATSASSGASGSAATAKSAAGRLTPTSAGSGLLGGLAALVAVGLTMALVA